MAIRRVTGAVSPSELIFADANALGATYDGSGTTIERGETFTLPAGGTTAVSNGALRLEALKGDCTITNNGNSTLTNASGVDGTIVMRSGASDFPAFVRNSSMGSMSTPAREDFTGDVSGTVSGTINSNATFPTKVTDRTVWYQGNKSGNSDTSFDYYRLPPSVQGGGYVRVTGCAPTGFSSIVSADYVLLEDGTGTGNSVSFAYQIGHNGVSYKTHEQGNVEISNTYAFTQYNLRFVSFLNQGSTHFEDVIAEGDVFGLRFQHGGGQTVYGVGVKITWRF